MRRALGFIAAVSLLVGCYASHGLPLPDRDATVEADARSRDAGDPPVPGTCRKGCTQPSDCGDVALRTCMDGACYFVGCDSDADCPMEAGCVVERHQCRQRCRATSDCAEVGSDNGEVACMDGLCRFMGCPSDAWCAGYAERWALEGDYRCLSRPESALPRCWRACAADADCGDPGDGHPRECVTGVCRAVECTATEQCRSWHEEDWLCVPR